MDKEILKLRDNMKKLFKEIATAFKDGTTATNPNGSFFVEEVNGVIIAFSYGQHFPIAIKLNDGFLFNRDGYSNTTARHKNLILSEIKDDLTENDFLSTTEIKAVVDKVKYNGIKTKAELIEIKI